MQKMHIALYRSLLYCDISIYLVANLSPMLNDCDVNLIFLQTATEWKIWKSASCVLFSTSHLPNSHRPITTLALPCMNFHYTVVLIRLHLELYQQ